MISNALPLSLIDNPILSQWISFDEPGRVRVFSGKVEIGQGILTAITQIAAEELDVDVEKVHVHMGDTRTSCNQGGASGSTGIQMGGTALASAAAEAHSVSAASAKGRYFGRWLTYCLTSMRPTDTRSISRMAPKPTQRSPTPRRVRCLQ